MKYEVVIIGGGPAGCAAALTLVRNGVSVALTEKPLRENTNRKIGESLPSSARPLLHKLKLLEIVENENHLKSYGNQSAWGESELTNKDFIADPSGYGWHLDRKVFDGSLRKLVDEAGVAVNHATVTHIEKLGCGWRVDLEAHSLEAGFLIDASGRVSLVGRQQGCRRRKDDGLVATYAWVESDADDHDTRTLIESSPNGWWYTSKLPGNARVLAFHSDADLFSESNTRDMWEAEISKTKHIRKIAGDKKLLSSFLRQNAGGSTLDSWVGIGWLACGDAAMTFDPLSSQGIFNALYTGHLAADAIVRLLEGETKALHDYSERLLKIRTTYLRHHQIYYASELRWPRQMFWRRRWPQDASLSVPL